MADETLNETASEEQPVQEAIADASSTETATTEASTASTTVEQPVTSSRTYAGKFRSDDELERAYLESQREASRMAGELSALKRTPDPATSTPKWKELEGERNKWAAHMRNPNTDEQTRIQADEQVRLYDREIAYERAKHDLSQQTVRAQAEGQLTQDTEKIFTTYKTDLDNPSSPLYQASMGCYQQLIHAGYPDSLNTKALAVAYAATLTGAGTTKAIAGDRSAMLKTLNQQVKQAVVTGAGGPTPTKSGAITAEQIDRMTPKEFAKYERQVLGV
jgi:hypothetical protein